MMIGGAAAGNDIAHRRSDATRIVRASLVGLLLLLSAICALLWPSSHARDVVSRDTWKHFVSKLAVPADAVSNEDLAAVPPGLAMQRSSSLRGGGLDDVAVENATSEGTETERRLNPMKNVWCVCCRRPGDCLCQQMYYSLMQCNPMCPAVCHSKGMRFEGCDGSFVIRAWKRMRTVKFQDCRDSPMAR